MRPKTNPREPSRRLRPALRRAVAALVPALSLALAPGALNASSEPNRVDIGRSVVVVKLVKGKYGEEAPKELKINDNIVFEEDISTGTQSKTVIEFRDGSTFELGPDAVVRIDSFIYNPHENTSHKTLSITSGAFRYLSGSSVRDQDTKIATSSGTLGIRGSIVSGFVAPKVPVFMHVTEGDATFANDAGSSALPPGSSIAVPSRKTKPMRPDLMPCPVAEQALRAIAFQLPPDQVVRERPPPTPEELRRRKELNRMPVAEQQKLQSAHRGAAPTATTTGPPIADAVDLLTQAAAYNSFDGSQSTQTPEQKQFRARVDRDNPDACADVQSMDAAARELHAELVQQSTDGGDVTPPAPPAPPSFGSFGGGPPGSSPGSSPAR